MESALGSVEVSPPNDPSRGFEFEDEVVLHAVLKLKQHQALAREVKFAGRFDDIVLVDKNYRQQGGQGYYLHQLMHKHDKTKNIGWEDLLEINTRSTFSLEEYFESYLQIMDHARKIVAVVIVTNTGFGQTDGRQTDFSFLVKQENMRKTRQPITEYDLMFYFQRQEPLEITAGNIFNGIVTHGKRYKFSPVGVKHVRDALLANKKGIIHNRYVEGRNNIPQLLEEFLKLLVFEVDTPSLDEVKRINRDLLKVFFPFYWNNVATEEQCCRRIKKELLKLFKSQYAEGRRIADWVTLERRQLAFEKLEFSFKSEFSLGSTTQGYEVNILAELFRELSFALIDKDHLTKISPELNEFFAEFAGNTTIANEKKYNPLPVVNVHCKEANATVITLKLFKIIRDSSMQRKTILIVQVRDEAGAKDIVEYLKALDKQIIAPYKKSITECSCFVIEVSPSFQPIEETNNKIIKLAEELSRFTDLRKWIQFVIVTQYPLRDNNMAASMDLRRVQDTPLKWNDLPEATRQFLCKKTLYLEDGSKSSMDALFGELTIGDWMTPTALAALIIHDETSPSPWKIIGFRKLSNRLL